MVSGLNSKQEIKRIIRFTAIKESIISKLREARIKKLIREGKGKRKKVVKKHK